MSNARRRIIHIDMDAFYAGVEQRDNPKLKGKPVAVGSLQRRHVVATASYEARAYGVTSGMPSLWAVRICPGLIFVPTRHDAYQEASDRTREIFLEYTSLVQPVSLDEAYLDVSNSTRDPEEIATEIRARVLSEVGLSCSAGVSYNKFLAKMASGENKPGGQFVVMEENARSYTWKLPVKKFHGVGPATASKMNALGIYTGRGLYHWDLESLKRNFGKSAEYFYNLARGIDERPVETDRVRKSSGIQKTFDQDITTLEEADSYLGPMARELWDWCQEHSWKGKTITVKIRFCNFELATRQKTLPWVVKSPEELREQSLQLTSQVFPFHLPVRLLGISISSPEQTTLHGDLGV